MCDVEGVGGHSIWEALKFRLKNNNDKKPKNIYYKDLVIFVGLLYSVKMR